MKTIAITIDEETLRMLDALTSKRDRARSRSALMRTAVREYAARVRREATDERERAILRKHRDQLRVEARALVESQADPDA